MNKPSKEDFCIAYESGDLPYINTLIQRGADYWSDGIEVTRKMSVITLLWSKSMWDSQASQAHGKSLFSSVLKRDDLDWDDILATVPANIAEVLQERRPGNYIKAAR
jgi:hypothetical protein